MKKLLFKIMAVVAKTMTIRRAPKVKSITKLDVKYLESNALTETDTDDRFGMPLNQIPLTEWNDGGAPVLTEERPILWRADIVVYNDNTQDVSRTIFSQLNPDLTAGDINITEFNVDMTEDNKVKRQQARKFQVSLRYKGKKVEVTNCKVSVLVDASGIQYQNIPVALKAGESSLDNRALVTIQGNEVDILSVEGQYLAETVTYSGERTRYNECVLYITAEGVYKEPGQYMGVDVSKTFKIPVRLNVNDYGYEPINVTDIFYRAGGMPYLAKGSAEGVFCGGAKLYVVDRNGNKLDVFWVGDADASTYKSIAFDMFKGFKVIRAICKMTVNEHNCTIAGVSVVEMNTTSSTIAVKDLLGL